MRTRRTPIARKTPLKRGKPPSRRPKASRKKLKAECDRLFSLFIRTRDGVCQLAGTGPDCRGVLQCAHLFSRRYLATRWNTSNAWGLCQAHHLYYTHRPLEWDELLRARIGEVMYDELREDALRGAKPDLAAVREELKWLREKYERLSRVKP